MTPSELKYEIESRDGDSKFFDRKTMRFFGDTMKNFGVRSAEVMSNFTESGEYVPDGVRREVWELYRKRAVKSGKDSFYFDKKTFARVHCAISI